MAAMASLVKMAKMSTMMTFARGYAVKSAGTSTLMGLGKGKKAGGGKAGAPLEKVKLPVETDVHKLVNYCCGANYFIKGEEVKLGADDDYPPWLWELRTGRAPTLQEMDPNTKKYWLKVRALGRKQYHITRKALGKF